MNTARSRRSRPSGITSTDLLLDTMCNTFGAIVLIAILVALLAQTAGPLQPDVVSEKENSELLTRRIATAEDEIDRLRNLLAEKSVGENEHLAVLSAKKAELTTLLAQLEAEAENADGRVAEEFAKSSTDLGGEFSKLKSDIAAAEARNLVLQNSLKTQNANAGRLATRANNLDAQVSDEREARVTILRFPKERKVTKSSLNVILRYGEAYPFSMSPEGSLYLGIGWEDRSNDVIATPIRHKGIKLSGDNSELMAILRSFESSEYQISFHIYPDSFELFPAVREAILSDRYDYGWSAMDPNATYTWGSGGSTPPPL